MRTSARLAVLGPFLCWVSMVAEPIMPAAADETVSRAGPELELRAQQVVVPHRDVEPRPTLGPRHAPVTIDVFIDFSALNNRSAYQHLRTLAARHPRRLRLVFHILDDPRYRKLTEAALGAHAQGRFFALMDELASLAHNRSLPATPDDVESLCERVGVDYQRIADRRHVRVFEENELFRRRWRVDKGNALLMLMVNGVPSSLRTSEVTLARMEEAYDGAYAKAKAKLDAGAAVEDIYHLSLLEADASIQPIRISAGAVNGERPDSAPAVIDHAPLIDPRAKVGGYRLGPEKARITIRLYCDFSTRFRACSETRVQIELVREHFPGLVRVFFHHMIPEGMDQDEHDDLVTLHTAALCAERQGAFETFYRNVYRMPSIRHRRRGLDSHAQLALVLESLDVDHARMQACMDDPASAARVLEEVNAARNAGVTASPTVVVGERVYPGSKTFHEVIRLVDIELMPGLLERLAPSPTGSPDWLHELL